MVVMVVMVVVVMVVVAASKYSVGETFIGS